MCRIRKKMKKKRRGAIWRAGSRRAPLNAVGKAEKREGEEEEEGYKRKGEPIRRAPREAPGARGTS